ncbi:MAG: hypothetical protein BGO70_00500 [Bacteroidetes bacterium 43-93]|nr:polysaccharide biosynthesis C-terminal domain-containing protein [Bacteroidota bacterium]OJW96200.1 MAG: hypothetical protein BGO70_00500 [Bacteroidetes bacterium 43-93]
MGIVFRQSVKTTIVTFTGAALGAITNYIYVFVFLRQQLGFYSNTITIGATLQLLIMMGTGSVLATYIQKFSEKDERRKVLLSLSLIVVAASILFYSTIFFVFRQQFVALYHEQDRQLFNKYYYALPLLMSLWGIMSLFDHYLISHVKIAFSAFVKEVVIRVCNLIIIALYYYRYIDFNIFILASVSIYALGAIILFIAASKTPGFGFSSDFKAFTKPEYRGIIHFAWYHLLFGLSQNLFGMLDSFMLGVLDKRGFESIAVYRNAVFVVALMVIPYRAMTYSSYTALNKAYIANDNALLQSLFKRSALNIFIVTMALFAVILCNLDNLVAILPPQYAAIKPVIMIMMLGRIIDMATGLNNEVISISRYYKFNFRSAGLLTATVFGFNVLLIPKYGIYGAAWGTTLAFTAINIFKLLFLWFKMRLQPFTRGSWLSLIAVALAIAAGYLLPVIGGPIPDAIVRSILILAVYAAMLLWLKPSEDLRNYLISIKTNKRLF